MIFKDIVDSPCGMRHMFEALPIQSGYARRRMLGRAMMTTHGAIEEAYCRLALYRASFASDDTDSAAIQALQFRLRDLRDIGGTLARLSSGGALDDIDLFEIKHLALLAADIDAKLAQAGVPEGDRRLPDLGAVAQTLDPDGLRMASFYIYDSYSPELGPLRARLGAAPENEQLLAEVAVIEDAVRRNLSRELSRHHDTLLRAMEELADIDIEIAKVLQIKEMGLCVPTLGSHKRTSYTGLFHPEVRDAVERAGGQYQPVDITLGDVPTIIVGANMGGKTVTLKALALSQALFQFGLGVPAAAAAAVPKEEIHFCIGDEQSVQEGLSSFAAEMRRVDTLLRSIKAGRDVIALIDEPARTTNPIEGTALVEALIKTLMPKHACVAMTTHYNIRSTFCKRLKVKGLENGRMDYSIVEAYDGEPPREAITIAEALGVDADWLSEAKSIMARN